jgi:hypothetical protein
MSEKTAPPIRRVETMEEAVEQGAAFLDVLRPGWEKTVRGAITDGLFSMREWDACVAGTLELYNTSGREARISFNGLSFPAYDNEPRWLGFLPLEQDDDEWGVDHHEDDEEVEDKYRKLDRLWREQVERRLPDATRPGP